MEKTQDIDIFLKQDLLRKPNSQASQAWKLLYAEYDRRKLVKSLQRMGVSGIEMSIDLNQGSDEDVRALNELVGEVKRLQENGIKVFIHPYITGWEELEGIAVNGTDPRQLDIYKAFVRLIDTASEISDMLNSPVALITHPFKVNQTDLGRDPRPQSVRSGLHRDTVKFYEYIAEYVDAFMGRVLLLNETQLPPSADEDLIRIGDRPDELLATVKGKFTGICWDTGHYMFSIKEVGVPEVPSRVFLSYVRHMHLHDVRNGKDHRYLCSCSQQVKEYFSLARQKGRLESITLEYNYAQPQLENSRKQECDPVGIMEHIRETCRYFKMTQ